MKDLIDKKRFPVLPKGSFPIRRRKALSIDPKYLPNGNRTSPGEIKKALRQEESEAWGPGEPDPRSFPLRGSVRRYDDPTGSGRKDEMDPEGCLRLLEEWEADDSGYDEENWEEIKKGLDKNRFSNRRLFHD